MAVRFSLGLSVLNQSLKNVHVAPANVCVRSLATRQDIPEPPKKPLSSYIMFANENGSQLRKSNPTMKLGDIGKKLGEQWRDLDANAKERYNRMSRDGRSSYVQLQKKSSYQNSQRIKRLQLKLLRVKRS